MGNMTIIIPVGLGTVVVFDAPTFSVKTVCLLVTASKHQVGLCSSEKPLLASSSLLLLSFYFRML